MKTSNFEAVKIAMKQDRTGYVLTLSVHPDEVPEEIMRDFVGARYQVVMVRLGEGNVPLEREQDLPPNIVQAAAMLCKDPLFHEFLVMANLASSGEVAATEWLREEIGIASRSELKTNQEAARKFKFIQQEFQEWKNLSA
jgi:hypothetical protein